MEKTLVLIKPDAVERNLIGKILSIYEDNGLQIKYLKMINASRELAEEHYIEHKDKPFFDSVVNYITRSPIVAVVLEGDSAIERVRKLNGSTKSPDPDTIRGKYATGVEENCVHASDSTESAKREMMVWFV